MTRDASIGDLREQLVLAEARADMFERRIRYLIPLLGDRSRCKRCDAAIYWLTSRGGRRMCYTLDGIVHSDKCKPAT